MTDEIKEKRITKRDDSDSDPNPDSDSIDENHSTCGSCNFDVDDIDHKIEDINQFKNTHDKMESRLSWLETQNIELRMEIGKLKLQLKHICCKLKISQTKK